MRFSCQRTFVQNKSRNPRWITLHAELFISTVHAEWRTYLISRIFCSFSILFSLNSINVVIMWPRKRKQKCSFNWFVRSVRPRLAHWWRTAPWRVSVACSCNSSSLIQAGGTASDNRTSRCAPTAIRMNDSIKCAVAVRARGANACVQSGQDTLALVQLNNEQTVCAAEHVQCARMNG